MKLVSLAVVVVLGMSASACVFIDADDNHPDIAVTKSDGQPLEALQAARVEKDDLVIRVSSNGCTRNEDFAVESSRRDGLTAFTFVRKRPDLCRALLPEGVELRYPLDAFGVERGGRVRVRNPLSRP
jgi:hypothetical protein